jgi:hypothetical protein
MTDLKIPFLKDIYQTKPEEIALKLIETGIRLPIEKINWPEHPYRPTTAVYAGYIRSHLWLRFMVEGDYIRAAGKNDQDPVYQDSCVEFFVQVGERYRNFEFNCLGVCLSAIGPDRYTREKLDPEKLSTIIRYSSFDVKNPPEEGSLYDWSLTVGIPLDLIQLNPGDKFRCNFYKCGDRTKIPHYVTWAPINIPAPDFHRPEYFGELQLE